MADKQREISLFKIFGVQIALDYSWFWVFLLVTASFAFSILPQVAPNYGFWAYLLYSLLGSFLFFSSVLIHELAHTVIAKLNNLPVNKISLFLLGGISNLSEEPSSPYIELKMAIAGPFASLIIGLILIVISTPLSQISQFYILANIALILGFINISLCIFNLLPGFPLDGGRILRALIWRKSKDIVEATKYAATSGEVLAVMLGFLGILQLLLLRSIGGLWLILVGIFLYQMAKQSIFQTIIMETLKKIPVREYVSKNYGELSSDDTVATMVAKIQLEKLSKFIILNNNKAIGTISVDSLSHVYQIDKRVVEIMVPINPKKKINSDESMLKALEKFIDNGSDPIIVYENDEISGILTMDALTEIMKKYDIGNKFDEL